MSDRVIVTHRDAVCDIRLNRPEKRNALTLDMYRALDQAIEGAEADPLVRVVVLSGEGGCLTAGNDLKDFLAAAPIDDPAHPTGRFVRALGAMRKVLIAAVHGPTVGIGLTLLLHCDLVVAARRSTKLIAPFVSLGLVPEAASTLLLPRLMGHQRAAEVLLLGQPLDAQSAWQCGLVNRVVDDERLMEETAALARAVAGQPGGAVLATKALMRFGRSQDVAGRMEEELREFARRVQSEEFKAAAQAFFARR